MQEATFLILTALAAEPLHGYGVVRAVESLSHGDVVLKAGTLYGALDRLAEQGLVEVDREEAVSGRLRRYYRLTDSGAAALSHQAARLRQHTDAAEAGLRRRPGGRPALGTANRTAPSLSIFATPGTFGFTGLAHGASA